MEPVKIAENIYWVGALDYDIRDFHGYRTSDGSTYNAYLIIDEKITLVDTVKGPFVPEMMSRISKIVDPKKIDQVISNHAEIDHAGGLPWTMSQIGKDKPIYTTKMGEKALHGQFKGTKFNLKVVGSGDVLSLGKLSLTFLETRMVHWPDSMFSFCPEMGILFSQDAFGMHLATSRRFDDEVARNVWSYEALKYFANILTLYTPPIAKTLETVVNMGLVPKIKMICPDHGLIWRSNPLEIIELYSKWVKQEPQRKAVIIYDTMWKSTEKMATYLGDALSQHNVLVKRMSMKYNHRSDVITELFEAGAILMGSPTLNNDMYPTIAEVLCYMRGLKFQNKIGAAFGSYGWSGEAAKMIQSALTDMKYKTPCPEMRLQWVPEESELAPLKEMAKTIAEGLPKTPVSPDFGLM